MAANTARHDQSAPSQVPSGTPQASAKVNPSQTTASARPERDGSTSLVAAFEATAMNTPCARPTRKRSNSKLVKPGAAAMPTLPTASTSMVAANTRRSDRHASSAVRIGAPMAAPSA